MIPFEPHPLLRNPHAMTLVASRLPRRFPYLTPPSDRLFEVEPGSRILGHCHWQQQPRRHSTLILVHGLEGSTESLYVLGCANKALAAGFNVIRLNQRNCGSTEHLTPTLYNSGLSGDFRAVVLELAERDLLPEIFISGWSMGGNLVLKMAGEFGDAPPPALRGVVGVCPSFDLETSAPVCDAKENRFYRWHFVRNLKKRYGIKARLFPERYRLNGDVLDRIRTIRDFDDVITAPNFGYRDAADYYHHASAIRVVADIRVPTLVLTAQDDPLIPFESFQKPQLTGNPRITLVAPESGGHCGFVSCHDGGERFWAEARIMEFCREHSELLKRKQGS
ncbi:MAG: alpha/beta fold hydrolase [Acidobacteria bacterium]|nr:alpha/beta fold hydrolase [Acidobacteriota bacterium]MBI3662252.1 alpha/beta fold hydrolase [Acidobacteriota bacterium]